MIDPVAPIGLPLGLDAMEIVKADGELAHLSREGVPEDFAGAVVALGGLGVVGWKARRRVAR